MTFRKNYILFCCFLIFDCKPIFVDEIFNKIFILPGENITIIPIMKHEIGDYKDHMRRLKHTNDYDAWDKALKLTNLLKIEKLDVVFKDCKEKSYIHVLMKSIIDSMRYTEHFKKLTILFISYVSFSTAQLNDFGSKATNDNKYPPVGILKMSGEEFYEEQMKILNMFDEYNDYNIFNLSEKMFYPNYWSFYASCRLFIKLFSSYLKEHEEPTFKMMMAVFKPFGYESIGEGDTNEAKAYNEYLKIYKETCKLFDMEVNE